MTFSLSKDLIFLIMQLLDEENFQEARHKLEQESGLYFNMKYFEELVLDGKWDEVERYLLGFTKIDDNRYSMKVFFEIRKQKYLEALDKQDRATAVDILVKDLKMFAGFNEELFKEITQLLTLNNFRENAQLASYRDAKTARTIMVMELKKLIEANPLFRDKTQFPHLRHSRLRILINQSFNWQHSLCPNPRQNPDISTLFVDHSCKNSNDSLAQLTANSQLMGSVPKVVGILPVDANGPFQQQPALVHPPLSTWISIPPNYPAASGGGNGFGGLTNPASSVRGPGDSDDLFKTRLTEVSETGMLQGINLGQSSTAFSAADFPKTVARTLNLGSVPTSMDFHPVQHTLFLVGTNVGDISLWDVSSREKLLSRSFQVWDIGASSMMLKATLIKDPCVSVKRIIWSPEGAVFGVAYSKHIIQLYDYFGRNEIHQHLEIDAHAGSVNDLAFSNPAKQLCVITCGDDKAIKVWNAITGSKLYTFEGHDAPVHSVCPHNKKNVHFIFSTSVNGKIKAWLYDNLGCRVDYDAPGHSCTTMAYSADGKRLFSCGTSKDGESNVVEWNENDGVIKRNYIGFQKQSSGVVQFDTSKNKYLAVGDDYAIKVWDMDKANILTTIDAEGGLPASPCIRFNKEGSLLAVSANDCRVKILATMDGLRLMLTIESHSIIDSRNGPETEKKSGSTRNLEEVKPTRLPEEVNTTRIWNLTQISETSQLRTLRLTALMKTDKISRLTYTYSGNAILALGSSAIHQLWRWSQDDRSSRAKATTNVTPQLMQQTSGILMTNDLTGAKPDYTLPCFALSKNDSYVLSTSGGKISLFNMMTFKTMTTFMSPPPVATSLAFHPEDNNVIAVGMDDSTIQIYNIRINEVKIKLKGHSKRVTGLAFSYLLHTLVSLGADAQLIVWNSEKWERENSCFLRIPAGRMPTAMVETQLQYHKDLMHILVIHESQLAIYETSKLECEKQWIVEESAAPISHATFSCDSQLVYASFMDGTVRIFTSNLQLQCQINPNAYFPADVSSCSASHPLVVAAHPQEPNQFAIGLTDGAVIIFEPLKSEDKWGVPPPVDNGLHTTNEGSLGIGSKRWVHEANVSF
ncbi:topless-related protein 1-like isoform X2 [Pyrus communis]|uniref:topless-related protein 1-like isoform X2 n=1 Tax=Pyrus communis TaxID=23211 RepID=UPI0035C07FD5